MTRLMVILLVWILSYANFITAKELVINHHHHNIQGSEIDFIIKTFGKTQIQEANLHSITIDSLSQILDHHSSLSLGINSSMPMFLHVNLNQLIN